MPRDPQEAEQSRHRAAQAQRTASTPERDPRVHCPSCHRRERWVDGTVEVTATGGARRPTVHPELAAWRTVLAAHRGETAPVVGTCAGCAQPLIGDAPPIPWTLHTPEGDLVVDGSVVGPNGPMSEADAAFWVEEQLRERPEIKPGLWLFQTAKMSSMILPLLALWSFALICFITFIVNFGKGP